MRNNRIIPISCFLAFVVLATSKSKLLMEPYLQAVTEHSIIIMSETDTEEPPFAIIYDNNGKELIFKANFFKVAEIPRIQTYIHRISVENLSSNSKYNYRVVHKSDTSDLFYFFTAAPSGEAFRFAVTGDGRSNPEIHSRITKMISQFNPRFILYTGDLCYSGKYSEWKSEFFTPDAQKVFAYIPFFNSLGNHEAQTRLTEVFLQAPKSESNDEFYYSFDYGDVHFLILNTESSISENSKQFNFAQSDLSNSKSKWKISVFHIPAYSSGGHNSNATMQKLTKKILEPKGVSLVFNGHNHFYQRNFINGIYHFTFGGGGAPLDNPKEADFVQKSIKNYSFGIVEVNQYTISLNVYDIRGEKIDEIIISR